MADSCVGSEGGENLQDLCREKALATILQVTKAGRKGLGMRLNVSYVWYIAYANNLQSSTSVTCNFPYVKAL